MRAIQIDRFGDPDVMHLADVPLGAPGPGEVLVRHRACGINYIDTYHRTGLYPLPLPAVLGTEGSGIVEAVGEGVTHLAVGDRVAYAARTPGSYAEARVLPAFPVVKLPDSIDFETGAAMMLKGLTVQYLLRRTRVELAPGDLILWHAAAGGVGLIACQWARALGIRLIGTAGTDEKCKLAEQNGAAYVINYSREDVVARVREITGGKGVSVVYDAVGKDTWDRSLDCLAPLGLMVSFGNASGPVPPVSLGVLSQKGSLYVQRPTLGTYLSTREASQAMADELFAMVTSGKVKIPVERRYALADARSAHRDLEARITTGSGVLLP
ncbi:MAG TPA: quinone oxidoreductase [Kofleriaceae bacterium]|nr:quinone oxidoreductase [Kofleriaceae bacterium]